MSVIIRIEGDIPDGARAAIAHAVSRAYLERRKAEAMEVPATHTRESAVKAWQEAWAYYRRYTCRSS